MNRDADHHRHEREAILGRSGNPHCLSNGVGHRPGGGGERASDEGDHQEDHSGDQTRQYPKRERFEHSSFHPHFLLVRSVDTIYRPSRGEDLLSTPKGYLSVRRKTSVWRWEETRLESCFLGR